METSILEAESAELRQDLDKITNQIHQILEGRSDFRIGADLRDAGARKLGTLLNLLFDNVRRTLADLGSQSEELEQRLRQRNAELQRARDVAAQANHEKGRFLASMRHELRTPLNAVLGYAEILQEECARPGRQDLLPDIEKIHGSGRHLLKLINDALDLAGSEAGNTEPAIDRSVAACR